MGSILSVNCARATDKHTAWAVSLAGENPAMVILLVTNKVRNSTYSTCMSRKKVCLYADLLSAHNST